MKIAEVVPIYKHGELVIHWSVLIAGLCHSYQNFSKISEKVFFYRT